MDIEAYMEEKGLNIPKMAEHVGLNRSYVWQIIHGKKNPTVKTAKKIEAATEGQVTAREVLGL